MRGRGLRGKGKRKEINGNREIRGKGEIDERGARGGKKIRVRRYRLKNR